MPVTRVLLIGLRGPEEECLSALARLVRAESGPRGQWVKDVGVPPQTIFEINASSRDFSSQVMRAKRQKDSKAIASFQQGREERQEGLAGPAPSCSAPKEEQPEEEEEEAGESAEVQALPRGPGVWAWVWGKGWVKPQQPQGCPQGSERSGIPVPGLILVEISNSALSLPICRMGLWGSPTIPCLKL